MRPFNKIALSAVDSASAQSFILRSDFLFCISAVAVGAAAGVKGVLKWQASNDQPQAAIDPTTFVDIASATVTLNGTAAGMIPKTDLSYTYLKLVWTPDGGGSTGNLTVKIQGWGVN